MSIISAETKFQQLVEDTSGYASVLRTDYPEADRYLFTVMRCLEELTLGIMSLRSAEFHVAVEEGQASRERAELFTLAMSLSRHPCFKMYMFCDSFWCAKAVNK